MSKFSLQVKIRSKTGLSGYSVEVYLPDHLDSKIGSSNHKNEIIAALESILPQKLGGWDWRKNGGKVESYNGVNKIK